MVYTLTHGSDNKAKFQYLTQLHTATAFVVSSKTSIFLPQQLLV